MISRRRLLHMALSAAALTSAGPAAAEPDLVVRRYAISPRGWPQGLRLRVAALGDFHFCAPAMTAERLRRIVARTNALAPDVVLLLGDFEPSGFQLLSNDPVARRSWARALTTFAAPLGVHAVLGNHDWWEDEAAQRRRGGTTLAERALRDAGIPVYNNRAVRLTKDGQAFWLAGVGNQHAFFDWFEAGRAGRSTPGLVGLLGSYTGLDDLPGTLARVTDTAPVILMAHEPDIFERVPSRVALTLAAHTHGGQLQVLGFAPVEQVLHGYRHFHGHLDEGGRHLVITAGVGPSAVQPRIGPPAEITVVDLGPAPGHRR